MTRNFKKYFKKITPQSYKVIAAFWSVTIFLFGFALLSSAVWNPPTANPPSANAPQPLNVTSTGQTKSGGLTVGITGIPGNNNGLYVGNSAVIGYTGPGNYLDPSAPLQPPGDTSLILEKEQYGKIEFLDLLDLRNIVDFENFAEIFLYSHFPAQCTNLLSKKINTLSQKFQKMDARTGTNTFFILYSCS